MNTIALMLATAVLLAAVDPAAGGGRERPDIVVFLADDLGWADCSPLGGRDIPMPNMARLADDGMTFTRAFVASPSCAPSRAALLTALEPIRNGAMLNHSRPRPELKTWPAYFQELGYEVVAFGKVGHYAQTAGYGFDHASHFNFHQDDCVEAAVAWLEHRDSERPLCLLVGTNWPHVPWPTDTDLDPDALDLPGSFVDTPATRRVRARYAAAVVNADRDLGLVREAARRHLGSDTLFLFTSDHGAQFPFGKWNLYDAGVRTPLIVAWPGRVEPGARSDALVSWIDLLPTLVEAAGGDPPPADEIDGRSFLDVLLGRSKNHRERIILTHSGDGTMNQYPIRALRTRRWKYIRNLDPDAEHHTHIDRGKRVDGRELWDSWVEAARTDPRAAEVVRRYQTRPAEELYDLDADPLELENLADVPEHARTLSDLRADLDAWMERRGDLGLETERDLQDSRTTKGAEK